jgi:hypothetical protein
LYHDDTFVPSIALEGTKHDAEPIWVPASRLGGKDEPPMPLFWTIDSGDLKQGAVGDCWLIAAVSCLANYPEEIEALFFGHGAEAAPDGRYTVLLYDHRKRSTLPIVIDERVPCRNLQPGYYVPGYEHLRGGVPCFAKPNGEMWPLLLEKAMAKMLGGYGSLNKGYTEAAFRALTGCTKQETWTRRMSDGTWQCCELTDDSMNTFQYRSGEDISADELWQQLEGWSSRNFLMSASVKASKGEVERRRPDGLIEGHAYSVLMTITVGHNLEGGPFRLLKLRNPWGSEAEWTGDWSDGSDTWTRWPQVADALNFRAAADGFFWMIWEDFIRTFSSLQVSHKTMRSGPGATRRAAWHRQEDAVSAQPDKKGAGASAPAAWSWLDVGEQWKPYEGALAASIEAAFGDAKRDTVDLHAGHTLHLEINFDDMMQYNVMTRRGRPVRREVPADPAVDGSWEWQDTDSSWKAYHPSACGQIALACGAGRQGTLLYAGRWKYWVDLRRSVQINMSTHTERPIRHRAGGQ